MSLSVSSPVTGAAQTGFTSPTYTLVAASPPNAYSKAYAVSAVGGTQTGVDSSSSPSRPFTATTSGPAVLRQLPALNASTGILPSVPMNTYWISGRKGVTVLTGQAPSVASATIKLNIPAGADIADPANIRALLSLVFGIAAQIASSAGDTCVTGVY